MEQRRIVAGVLYFQKYKKSKECGENREKIRSLEIRKSGFSQFRILNFPVSELL